MVLEINRLALNSCFKYRNIIQNGVMALSRIVFKKSMLKKRPQNLMQFGHNDFVKISLACGTNNFQGKCGDTLDFQCQHKQLWQGGV